MGQRVIPVAVTAEYIGGDGVTLGAAGSHNSVVIEYDFRAAGSMWDDPEGGTLIKYVLWTNPQGNTTNRVDLGVDKLVPGYDSKVYHASPTADAMCVAGWAEMVVVGAVISDGTEVVKVKTEPSRFRVLPGSSSAADNEGIAATVADQLQSEIETVDSRKVSKPQSPYDPDGEPGQFLVSRGNGLTEWADYSPEAVEEALDKHPEWITRIGDGTVSEEKLQAGSVTNEKLGADVQNRLEALEPIDPINSTSTKPAQAKAVYDAIAAEAAARKQKDDELAAADEDIRSQMISPLSYKGACTYENLPANPSVNDAWYVTDRDHLMAWNGSEWGQAGPDSYDLMDALAIRTKDCDLTEFICTDSVEDFQNETADLTVNMVAGVNATKLDLYRNVLTYSDDTSGTTYATGSTYFSFLISAGARFLGSGNSDPVTSLLTTDDFVVFPAPGPNDEMIFDLSLANEKSARYREYPGQDVISYPVIILATKNLLTGEINTYTVANYGISISDASHGQYTRSYPLNITKQFPAAIENRNIAVIFRQRRAGINGGVRMRFYHRRLYSDLSSYWDTEINESVRTINKNIMDGASDASTILFITDLHWDNNKKKSPKLAKKLLDSCDFDFFVNGGDMVYSTHKPTVDSDAGKAEAKNAAMDELTDCMAAFRAAGCRLPMIPVYGNHDRNRDGFSGGFSSDPTKPKNDWKQCIRRDEHLALTMFRDMVKQYGIQRFPADDGSSGVVSLSRYTGDGGAGADDAFYWEDERYRYAVIYWYNYHNAEEILYDKRKWENTPADFEDWKTEWEAQTREERDEWLQENIGEVTPIWVPEIFNTDKPVVILTHGIYFDMFVNPNALYPSESEPETYTNYDREEDRKHAWMLDVFAPYKSKIRCIIQGHSHIDGLRYAYRPQTPVRSKYFGEVPIVIIDCDTFRVASSKAGTISEQSLAAITIEPDQIKVVKIGRGQDWPVITANTNEFTYNYTSSMFVYRENPPETSGE